MNVKAWRKWALDRYLTVYACDTDAMVGHHEWEYYEDSAVKYTGYLERCIYCPEIRQIPQ